MDEFAQQGGRGGGGGGEPAWDEFFIPHLGGSLGMSLLTIKVSIFGESA